jgi:hypothetical protein
MFYHIQHIVLISSQSPFINMENKVLLVVTCACKARHGTDAVQQWKMFSGYHTGYEPLT